MAGDDDLFFPSACSYQPLQAEVKEIRLLHIKAADSQYELIDTALHVVPLDDAPEYTLLVASEIYEPHDHAILCGGYLHPMALKTYSVLQQFRETGEQWLWWEDLCINQSDAVEGLQQKDFVSLIHRKAKARHYVMTLPLLEYPPLTETDGIRLLELQPPNPLNGPLVEFNFRTVSLERAPDFNIVNLSIPMPEGVETPKNSVLISKGFGLLVREIVFKALSQLLSSPYTTLWIEELCINHGDPRDKSHHAILIERIHDKSTKTLTARRPNFQYQPVATTKCEIRLLRIHKAMSRESPLLIQIFTASLDDLPEYVALSYVWGSSQRNCGIICSDGSMLRVTPSLFTALQEARQQSFQVVWADQVCINQEDLLERSQQVTLMRRIYQQARSVVIHLSPASGTDLTRFIHPDWAILVRILASTYRVTRMTRPENGRIDLEEISKFGIPPLKHRSWKSWVAVRAHPWFTRGWIIQEIGVNADAWVLCDRCLLKWSDLEAANALLRSEVFDIHINKPYSPHFGRYFFHNLAHLKEPKELASYSLLNLISVFREVQTSDPRDKIYAFLGIAADSKHAPAPDYSHPVYLVYQEFARFFISQGEGIALLCEAGIARSNLENPSWVADWTFRKKVGQINYANTSASSPNPCLKRLSNIQKTKDITLTDDPLVISVKSLIVDTIFEVTAAFQPFQRWKEIFSDFDKEARVLWQQNGTHRIRYGAGLHEAYAKTLILSDDRFEDPLGLYEEARAEYLHDTRNGGTSSEFVKSPKLDGYHRCRLVCLDDRRFGITAQGYLGLFPMPTREGDSICFFKGCKTPFVVRKGVNAYILIGDAYVHDFVLDEFIPREGVDFEEILLG